MPSSLVVSIESGEGQPLSLTLYEQTAGTLFKGEKTEIAGWGEEAVQLVEGMGYEYELTEGYELNAPGIVFPSGIPGRRNAGRIRTNIFVGVLPLQIWKEGSPVAEIRVEVRSVKMDYRTDYRRMLEDITQWCADLAMLRTALNQQRFSQDPDEVGKTLYQRFMFVRSVIDSENFNDAVHRVLQSPVKKWKDAEVPQSICRVRHLSARGVRQIASGSSRIALPENHPLRNRMESVPDKISMPYREETTDNPENRFVKYVLTTFALFCDAICRNPRAEMLRKDAAAVGEKLRYYLSHSIFRGLAFPAVLPLSSPVLQRREGYREILQVWLMFDMAARLIWTGGEEVYEAGKRDVAVLYEYWLFFELLGIVQDVFRLEAGEVKNLVSLCADGLELTLKRGQQKILRGTFGDDSRQLCVEFCYNRTFGSGKDHEQAGSWTTAMRPDYTLSFWPKEMSRSQAEKENRMAHLHFDAKYRIENLKTVFGNPDLEGEPAEQENYKRDDLLKMHAYKDAIRRTAGAYIIYPGTEHAEFCEFPGAFPALGAFPLSPGHMGDGRARIRKLLSEAADYFSAAFSRQF